MDKKRQYLITSFIAVALVTLVAIQLFWIKQSMSQEQKDFNKKARNALDRVAIRHEKAEDFRKYKALWKQNFKGHYQDMLKQEFQNVMSIHEEVTIRDTVIKVGDKDYNYLIITGKTIDSLTGLKAEHQVLAKNVKEFEELISPENNTNNPKTDVNGIPVKWGTAETQELFKKSKYISELMVQAFRNDLFLGATERLDLNLLDSILFDEFKREDLDMGYHFQVVDQTNQLIKSKSTLAHYDKGKLKNAYDVKLFPGDMFSDAITLRVEFPFLNRYLWEGLWGVILVVALVIFIMIATFTLMYKTLISQRKLSEMKNDFISNMTHEFKTPISTIALACEALVDKDMGDASERSTAFVSMIDEENKRLEALVESILQSAVMDKGELRLHLEKVEFNSLVHSLLNRTRMKIESLGGTLIPHIAIGECYVLGDKSHLMNVVNNLIDNAIKYSKEELVIEITTECIEDKVILTVKDKGIGIKKEHIPRIFDKLYRVPTGNVHNVKGFGLGLSYVKSIVELHEGEIQVESQVGVGSIFKLILKRYHE
ncbi:MAG: ATP-binding protein [Crocinitomicaceae bacterium]